MNSPTPEDCPTKAYHKTHAYCPSCSFVHKPPEGTPKPSFLERAQAEAARLYGSRLSGSENMDAIRNAHYHFIAGAQWGREYERAEIERLRACVQAKDELLDGRWELLLEKQAEIDQLLRPTREEIERGAKTNIVSEIFRAMGYEPEEPSK